VSSEYTRNRKNELLGHAFSKLAVQHRRSRMDCYAKFGDFFLHVSNEYTQERKNELLGHDFLKSPLQGGEDP